MKAYNEKDRKRVINEQIKKWREKERARDRENPEVKIYNER